MNHERAMDQAQATGRRMEGTAGGASRSSRTRLAVVVAALALLGLAAAAQSPPPRTHSIHMTAPARIPLGQSGLIRINGVVAPPAEFWDESWIEVVALPGTLMPECPGDAQQRGQHRRRVREHPRDRHASEHRRSRKLRQLRRLHGARGRAGHDLRLSLQRGGLDVGRGDVAPRSRRARRRRGCHGCWRPATAASPSACAGRG